MKNTLKAIYLRLDSTSQTLSKSALAQLILKVIYYSPENISSIEIQKEVEGLLGTNINIDRINSAIELLNNEGKIHTRNDKYFINPSRKRKIESVFNEYDNRVNRIIECFFQPVKSSKENIRKWFENITICYFSEYKSEWIAEKTYNIRQEDSVKGLQNILEIETKKDKDIENEDKEWLKKQYVVFFNSQNDDVISIFWDYGMCAYSSSLIVSSTGADEVSIDSLKNSIFIIDTNILMYLMLEEDKYHEAYKSLENIFLKLGITPSVFYITREEYVKTMSNKKEQILRVLDKYDDEVIEALNDPFIKTAKARGCLHNEDYEVFFNELLDIPDEFVEDLKIKLIDDENLKIIIEQGMVDENLINELNEIYKTRHQYRFGSIKEKHKDELNSHKKDKRKRPLIHDAGIIRGTEHVRKTQKSYILTRDITVKQYGINKALRDDLPISIGLDNLISMLAIDNGGIDIDPSNFKPLFVNMIKLALIPEKNTFQTADLVTMIDIEQQISDLPSEEIISIATELNRNKMMEMDDEKVNLQLIRRYQQGKIKFKKEIDVSRHETEHERKEKEKFAKKASTISEAFRKKIYDETKQEYDDKLLWSRIKFYLILPFIFTVITLVGIYCFKQEIINSLSSYLLGLFSNFIIWALTSVFYFRPRIRNKHINRVKEIDTVVERKIIELTKNEE